MWIKRIISTHYIGLCNRLEGLALCFACREHYGHAVCLDWPERQWLAVAGTKRWIYNPIDKLLGHKLRDPSAEEFHQLGRYRVLIQRGTTGGDAAVLDRLFMPTMGRLRLWEQGQQRLATYLRQVPPGALLVGVHVRRGDFQRSADPRSFDIHASRHPQVPLWWYVYAMERVQRQYGNVCFLLSHNMLDLEEEALLRQRFAVLPALDEGQYHPGGGHAARSNPVLDLYALACCPVIIASPMSTFSHFAAHVLGPASLALQPWPRMSSDAPGVGITPHLAGLRSPAWTESLTQLRGYQCLGETDPLPLPARGVFDGWFQTPRER
ncbi:MAG: hypothetical protein H7831_14225 [Magnetococcus sp. WYHC-3]